MLCIAPQYSGTNQREINESSESILRLLQSRLQEQIAIGREINVETLRSFTLTAADIQEKLKERRDLIFYIGHAHEGELVLGDSLLDVEQIPREGFEGAVVVLIGCTTEGWRSLSSSVANQLFALGSRAVFSVSMKLHIRMAEELSNDLFAYLVKGNWHFAEVLQIHRFSVMYTCTWIYALALLRLRRPEIYKKYNPKKTMFISEADTAYASFQNGWDAMYRHFEAQFATLGGLPITGSEILRRMAPFGLTLTFNGRLRDRLFAF